MVKTSMVETSKMVQDYLTEWNVLKDVDKILLTEIQLFHIFGYYGESALCVSRNGEVWAKGKNPKGLLGIGSRRAAPHPVKISQLYKRNISAFSSGDDFVVALTSEGNMYTWGSNQMGQLGNGSKLSRNYPGLINSPVPIIVVATGAAHSLGLASTGKVYSWGWNCFGQCGNNHNKEVVPRPSKVQLPYGAISIAAGNWHSVALLETGEVYIWGDNREGRLSLTPRGRIVEPGFVVGLHGVQLIACGPSHTLALCSDTLFAWGNNQDNCLAVEGSYPIITNPQPVHPLPRVFDIFCTRRYEMSSALTEEGIYVWGWSKEGDIIRTPRLTNEDHLPLVFTNMEIPCLSILRYPNPETRCLEFNDSPPNHLNLPALFDNEEISDLTIVVGDRKIFVHKVILKATCKHFQTLLAEPWLKEGERELIVQEYSPIVYEAFLKYLYTHVLEDLQIPHLIEFWHLCNSYLEKDLKEICAQQFQRHLSVENVADLYSETGNQQCETLERLCFHFIIKNFHSFVLSPSYESMDPVKLKALLKSAAQVYTIKIMDN